MAMDFELLDSYLLDGSPPKAEVVRELLTRRPHAPGIDPFYEGMERLGPRTPDLTLVAVRLVLAGKKADDASVTRLRDAATRARAGESAARTDFRDLLRATP